MPPRAAHLVASVLALAIPDLIACGVPASAEEAARVPKVEKEEVHLVLIDAIVTGKDKQPLRGLRREDFTLRVDGKNAPIAGFEDHCPALPPSPRAVSHPGEGAMEAAAAASTSPADGDGFTVPAGSTAQPPTRIVLYFDLPHLSPSGAARSVGAARRFLESAAEPAARYMVTAYGRSVKILMPFTTDRSSTLAALGEVLEIGGPYDEGSFARLHKIQQVTRETCPDAMKRPMKRKASLGLGAACPNQVAMAKVLAREEERLARRSLAAVKALLIALSHLEGRKALVFFTETLKDEPGVQYLEIAKRTPRRMGIDLGLEFGHAVDEAGAASVAFYPVYAAGLGDESDAQLLRSHSSLGGTGTIGRQGPNPSGHLLGSSMLSEEVGPIGQAYRTAEAASVGFNASIAAETGGRHLGRTNDLSAVFPIVMQDLSCYYVVGHPAPPPHDGRRHTLRLDVGVKGARVRSRTFYVDWTPEERHERRFRTALAAPGAFRDFDAELHVFPFGRSRHGRKILVMTDVPVAALAASTAGIPPDDGAAAVELRGRVAAEGTEVCAFASDFTLPDAARADGADRTLHVEAACDLAPGRYEVLTAVVEKRGGAMAAARRGIGVPEATGFHVSEPQLWAASGTDIVEASQAGSIVGAAAGILPAAASPRPVRRLGSGERGAILFLVCPDETAPGSQAGAAAGPVTVTRTILSGPDPVATFPPLRLDGPPDEDTGCWGVSSPLPEKVFGDGIYQFDYEVNAPGLAEPVRGRAAFEVTTSTLTASPPAP